MTAIQQPIDPVSTRPNPLTGFCGKRLVLRLALFVLLAAGFPFSPLPGGFTDQFLPISVAHAQSGDKTNEDEEAAEEKPQDNGLLPPLYDQGMLRLSEILGALHYLRTLCDSGEGQLWRSQMNEMIVREDPSKERKEKMVAHFNKGFRSYQEVYRECTPAAVESSNRFLREGIKISAEIPARYGN